MGDREEAAILRQQIARLDEKLQRLRTASQDDPPAAPTDNANDLSPDLANYLRDKDIRIFFCTEQSPS
ncbi:hypothetical protein ACJ73_07139 [Blastomyces percursus]|uniref:Uncharacterized protein n=1 Tax=Blastomyces percursus TaxID=1658174 RepID=A0A1J9R1N6_9EURO|nr:hypothetical protein ACJ73_07139 [Blastomyces percursus]